MLSVLQLENFRNYISVTANFTLGINVILGNNGQGKTNLMEGIYYLSLLRSFRSTRTQILSKWESDGFYIGGMLTIDEYTKRKLTISYLQKRILTIDNSQINKASEFINQFICLAFIPEDIVLVTGSSRFRRRFMDITISQHDPIYLHNLQSYKLALKSRNILLKQPQNYNYQVIKVYEEQMIKFAAKIVFRRKIFINKLNEYLQPLSKSMFKNDNRMLNLNYVTNTISGKSIPNSTAEIMELYQQTLDKNRDKAKENRITKYGPHRDDFSFLLGDSPLSLYGSAGECRLASISLRLAAMKIIKEIPNNQKNIVLLLDDIFGELDDARREAFLHEIDNHEQIFLATTNIPKELNNKINNTIQIKNGIIQ